MTRINVAMAANFTAEWVQKNQDQIKAHPAWHDSVSESKSDMLLKDQSPFTYLLRSGEEEHSYFISFIKEDGSIKHQFFVLEPDRKGWYYRNGSTINSPAEIISKDINELIPLMMHCDSNCGIPLTTKSGVLK